MFTSAFFEAAGGQVRGYFSELIPICHESPRGVTFHSSLIVLWRIQLTGLTLEDDVGARMRHMQETGGSQS